MTSERQYTANRQNALRSTGPTSAAGKMKSSNNAVTHGLTAASAIIIDGENEADYAALHRALLAEFEDARRSPARYFWPFCQKRRVHFCRLETEPLSFWTLSPHHGALVQITPTSKLTGSANETNLFLIK